jgi:hypothetical protein
LASTSVRFWRTGKNGGLQLAKADVGSVQAFVSCLFQTGDNFKIGLFVPGSVILNTMQLAGAICVSLVGRFYDRLRATRWRALKIARAMSRVLGKHDIESEVFFYRLEFRFTKFMGLRSRRGTE